MCEFFEIEFNYLNDNSDINKIYDQSIKDISLLLEKHVPTKQCSKKRIKIKRKALD